MIPSHSHRSTIALPSLYHPSPEYHHHRDGKWAYHPISTRILIPFHPINTESKYHPIPSAPDSHYHPIPSTPDADYHPIPSMHFFMFPIPSHYHHQRKWFPSHLCCCCCFLTLTDPLRIQPWSQDRRKSSKKFPPAAGFLMEYHPTWCLRHHA